MGVVAVDRLGLTVAGKRLYLLSGQIHYFRWPRAEWRRLLVGAKAGGLNTVDTVIPWNLHEPEPGVFYFQDEADLPAWLDLCHELGLYAIVRPGPYICAEWENGGFPAWLTGRGGRLRTDDPDFLEAVGEWFDVLIPLLAARQIDRGGPILLTQIENEHWASGVYGHDDHQATLARMLSNRGISVPFYTCMGPMNGVAEFRNGWSGIADKLRATRAVWPDNPMIVSELWSGWFDSWGASAHNGKTPAALDRVLHELLAVGASGFSHWMWAGGTNFGWWGGRTVGGDTIHMTTSYDYDAIVDEYGRPTPKFFVARRHHLFFASLGARLSQLLAEAGEGGPVVLTQAGVKGRAAGGDPPYRLARNGSFSAAFLQNTGLERQTVQVFHADPRAHLAVEVEAGSIKPIFANLSLAADLTLGYHSCRILGFWGRDDGRGVREDRDLLVCYGFRGEVGELMLRKAGGWRVEEAGGARVTVAGDEMRLYFWIGDRPTIVRTDRLTIVLLVQEQAERWGMEEEEAGVKGQEATVDLKWEAFAVDELYTPFATTPFFDFPRPCEDLGCFLGYGVYSARFVLAGPVEVNLAAPWLVDRGHLFIDGERMGTMGVSPEGPGWTLPVRLDAGEHELRLLVDNLGRFNYGSNTGERKGLLDTLYWSGEQIDITTGWSALWQEAAFAGEAIANAKPGHLRADAADVDLGHFAFQGPQVWLLREIEQRAGERVIVQLTGDRNSGALYVNGQTVERFSRHHGGGFIKREITAWLRPGANVLALQIANYAGAAWRATMLRFDPAQALRAEWRFRGGVTPAERPPKPGHPGFFRARFACLAAWADAQSLRLAVPGLGKGHLWLNGRSLGRYWQIGPQEFYKVPVSWLQAENELLVFEEENGRIDDVTIRPG